MEIEFNGKKIETDHAGYLLHYLDWSEDVAVLIAQQEGLTLTHPHWEVIGFLRDYYEEFKIAPAIRVLIKAIGKKLGADKGDSIYLYKLFPNGPAVQACKIAGLPKPTGCV